ncbi:MAG: flagellar filament capping protein FliD [Methylococcales bacterium]|nr:flagellar filament capping protein FliD [Methylococcales bacterium]
MAITSSVGVGSGIDINGTVSQITAAEGKPQLDAIAAKATISQTKLSGLGTLKSALSTFQSAVKALDVSTAFQAQQITSSDEKILKVSVDPASTSAPHTIKVIALAKAQKSVSTAEFKSTDVVSEGMLIFNDNAGAPKFSATITKGVNDTITGLRDAINNAKGNSSVVASIVNVDSKTSPGTTVAKLVLTAKTPGLANSFSIDASMGDARFNLDAVSTPMNFGTTEATDANLIIDPQPGAATAQRSVANVEFSGTDVVAPGLISFKDSAGIEKFSVNIIKGGNDKIFAAMDAINNAPGNTSVVASVINVESKNNPGTSVSKLVFTAKQPGIDNKFVIDASEGDVRLSLDGSPVNAQQSTSSIEFAATDKVLPGTLVFKDSGGAAKFSVNIAADVTTTVGPDGNTIPVDADGNLVIPNDANGVPVATTTKTTKGNDTLEQLRDAINYNPENKLVLASIVSIKTAATTVQSDQLDSNGNVILTTIPEKTTSKLVLTALKSGADKGFTVDGSAGDTRLTLDPVNAPTNFTSTSTLPAYDTTAATNPNDGGQSVTRSSNSIGDAIPGVTLNLVAVGTSEIDTKVDQGTISKPISAFVDSYNKLSDSLKQLTNYVGPGDSGNGALLGDSTLQSIISQVKQIINSKVSSATGDYNSLNQLGVSFDKKGVMSLDNTKLQAALSANLTSVGDVFASTNGIATQLNTKITQYLDSNGVLSTEQDSLNKQLTQLTTEKAAVNTRLAATQKSLQKQFIAMDTAVSQFKNTGTYLTQALTPKNNNN